MDKETSDKSNIIAYVSTYPPRECGIATFTQDLTNALDKKFNPATKSRIVAVNDNSTSFYNYGEKLLDQITAPSLDHYVALAEKLNVNPHVKLVNIQHEFGIFGGEWGDYVVPFLQVLKKPVVTTFHSVLARPESHVRDLVRFIVERSKRVVVMNSRSRDTLVADYGVPKQKIVLIPHGIPETTFEPSEKYKKELGLQDNIVLSTFGFLSKDKGIQYALRALPAVIAKYPNVTYLVLGETHPVVRSNEGEEYRNFLIREVEQLNIGAHVRFYNKYLSSDELIRYLKATDIYVSTLVNPAQSVSGTLSYALGCGRPVVATATEYAKHIVTMQTGKLVRFKSPESVSRAVLALLADQKGLHARGQIAYEATRKMTWPNVAQEYFRVYQKYAPLEREDDKLPDVKLDHMMRLTDDFGIMHHAKYSKPERRYGYSMDDNARALVVAAKCYAKSPEEDHLMLIRTYLKFMRFVRRPTGTFANIVSAKRQRDGTRTEDVHGRALWALGFVAAHPSLPEDIRREANAMFAKSVRHAATLESPRAIAFAMTGLYFYLKHANDRAYTALFTRLAARQLKLFTANATEEWKWFEDNLTYSNSKLPESLFYAYDLTKDKKYLHAAQASLKFLTGITFEERFYSPIGQNGWYFKHKKRAYYDQQPEDAASMVETKIAAYQVTHEKKHLADAYKAFQWFLGRNHLNQMVYNEVTGGCYDGVGDSAINLNEGAESTISYLLARLALEEANVKPKTYAA